MSQNMTEACAAAIKAVDEASALAFSITSKCIFMRGARAPSEPVLLPDISLTAAKIRAEKGRG